MLALRRDEPVLRPGYFELLHPDDALLMFARDHGNDRVVCIVNLSIAPQVGAGTADLTRFVLDRRYPCRSCPLWHADRADYSRLMV